MSSYLLNDTDRRTFRYFFRIFQKETYAVSEKKGLEKYVKNPLYTAAKLALIMSEAVEALEWDRANKPKEIGHDLADIVIRTMDLAEALHINLGEEILKKHDVNKKRARKRSKSRY